MFKRSADEQIVTQVCPVAPDLDLVPTQGTMKKRRDDALDPKMTLPRAMGIGYPQHQRL
jgi:hypothetical protein